MKKTLCVLMFLLVFLYSNAQHSDTIRQRYEYCFDSLKTFINNNGSFKKAVFLTENCFLENQMNYDHFDRHIRQLATVVKLWQKANPLLNYHLSDSINFHQNFAVFKMLKDTIKFISPDQNNYFLLPYTYDFNDFFGRENWSNMFVTKLLASHKGNCHSLPYLYKILADELNATCWISLAPDHIYIKNRCKQIGWYNTELTSGDFPIDAWITASGYIPLKAIQTGIYMDTLSNQQTIALCVIDLAKCYEFQTKNYYDGFIIKCCELALKYHPANVQAMLLKAETLKRIYEKQMAEKVENKEMYSSMEQLYVKLFDLGYREMPEKMYLQWLMSVNTQKGKYSNKQLKQAFNGSKK